MEKAGLDSYSISDLYPFDKIIHPDIYYEGDWYIDGSLCVSQSEQNYINMNAKMIDGKNAYQEFLKKNYFSPLGQILGSQALAAAFQPALVLEVDEKTKKRVLRFSLQYFLIKIIAGLMMSEKDKQELQEFLSKQPLNSECLDYTSKLLREDRKKYQDVKDKDLFSSFYGIIHNQYLSFIRENDYVTFETYLDTKIVNRNRLIRGVRNCSDFFDKEIDVDAFLQTIDEDKLYLAIMLSSIDMSDVTEKDFQALNNSLVAVKHYLDAIDFMKSRLGITYYATIDVYNKERGTIEHINVNDVRKRYNALLARHPEAKVTTFHDGEIEALLVKNGIDVDHFDLQTPDDAQILQDLVRELQETKEISVPWELIPKGPYVPSATNGTSGPHVEYELPEDEKNRRMIICRNFLENSNYIYKLYGKDKFEGYIGYVYPNGKVILEKYYENERTHKVASGEATYIMNVNNFIWLTKISKSLLIRIYKNGKEDLHREYHRENMDGWIASMQRYIDGADYSSTIMTYIDELIEDKVLQFTKSLSSK